MKNECDKCGGGFGGYTAPEARCTCAAEARHDLRVAEGRYLFKMGWEPLDDVLPTREFLWKSPALLGGIRNISHETAVATQKEIDRRNANPVRAHWLNGVTTLAVREAAVSLNRDSTILVAELELSKYLRR